MLNLEPKCWLHFFEANILSAPCPSTKKVADEQDLMKETYTLLNLELRGKVSP